MKYLGIDYGTKRVGIAISDEEGSFAFPKDIVSLDKSVEYIASLVQSEDVQGIVIGQSVASNGVDNEVVVDAKSFASRLENKISVPIFFEREDFSSVEAHRYQTKKGSRDDSAAAVILQRFLDKKQK
jgi:putative Holliday junction resolvase